MSTKTGGLKYKQGLAPGWLTGTEGPARTGRDPARPRQLLRSVQQQAEAEADTVTLSHRIQQGEIRSRGGQLLTKVSK